MSRTRMLSRIWQVVREVDLEAIRQQVRARFQLLVVAETRVDAEGLRELFGWNQSGLPHPWLIAADPAEACRLAEGDPVRAALVWSRAPALGPALAAARERLREAKVPVVTLVTDSVGRGQAPPGDGVPDQVTVDALDDAAVPLIGEALLTAVGTDGRLALAAQLPALRPVLFSTLIDETARANAGYALTTALAEIVPLLTIPLNLGDVVVLTKNQLVMSYKIALVAGKDGTPRALVAEILAVLSGGLLFRQVARQLVGLIPLAGIPAKIAVAYGGTWTIGRAVVLWATEGGVLSAEAVRDLFEEGAARGRQVAERLMARARQAAPIAGRWRRSLARWRARTPEERTPGD